MPKQLPKATKLKLSGFEDQSLVIALSGSDQDGSITGYVLTSLPSNGNLFLDASLTIPATIGTVYLSNTFSFFPQQTSVA